MKDRPILTLQSLAQRLKELADRAFDATDRNSNETDAEVAAQIALLQGICDSCVWGRISDYEDEGRAWTYLRSDPYVNPLFTDGFSLNCEPRGGTAHHDSTQPSNGGKSGLPWRNAGPGGSANFARDNFVR